jgi:pilus assembly protein Flp/PilA
MIKLNNTFRRFLKDTRGANMVEYILLVGVVALISIAAFKAFGAKVQEKIKAQGDTVGEINSGAGG